MWRRKAGCNRSAPVRPKPVQLVPAGSRGCNLGHFGAERCKNGSGGAVGTEGPSKTSCILGSETFDANSPMLAVGLSPFRSRPRCSLMPSRQRDRSVAQQIDVADLREDAPWRRFFWAPWSGLTGNIWQHAGAGLCGNRRLLSRYPAAGLCQHAWTGTPIRRFSGKSEAVKPLPLFSGCWRAPCNTGT